MYVFNAMRIKLFVFIFLPLTAALLSSCCSKDQVVINGQFFGASDQTVYLQELAPGREWTLDSAVCDSKGRFKFKTKVNQENPTFLNLRMDNSFVPLLVEPGQRIDVEAIGNIYVNYTVNGSPGSELLHKFNSRTVSTVQKLDSLSVLYDNEMDTDRMQELGLQYSRTYINLKRDAISFLVKNSKSLVAVVPLYQPIFGNRYLFDSPSDIAYFKLIAESLGDLYPTSPYVSSLKADVGRIRDMQLRDSLLRVSLSGKAADYIDIKMKDAKGDVRTLSSLAGNVILLDFTSSQELELKTINRELAQVYEKYHDRGFEVYQVSLDNSKQEWINTVIGAGIPWISVCDFMGTESPVVRSYNITRLPSNFLIDRQGNIVAKDIRDHALETALESLL